MSDDSVDEEEMEAAGSGCTLIDRCTCVHTKQITMDNLICSDSSYSMSFFYHQLAKVLRMTGVTIAPVIVPDMNPNEVQGLELFA